MAQNPKRNGRNRRRRAGIRAHSAEEPEPSVPEPQGPHIPHSAIELSDTAVEEALRTGDQPGLLEDLFGTAGYAELRALARDAAARSVRGGERVLILPGIMGSKLGFPGLGPFEEALWIGPLQIAAGRLDLLRLPPSGDQRRVQALGVLLFAYLALKLRLRIAGHDAQFSPFDWRLGISALGANLARQIDEEPSRTTHLVAHSMGGLVARAALSGNPRRLGRVVTLGTPNYGSYSPVQAFRGVHSIVQKISLVDIRHDQAELAQDFPGPARNDPGAQAAAKRFVRYSELAEWRRTPRPNDAARG